MRTGILLLFSFLCDIGMAVCMPRAVIVFRILVFFVFFGCYFYKRGFNPGANIFIYLFFIYTLALIPFSSNFERSLAMQANIFIPMFMYIAVLGSNKRFLEGFSIYAFFILPCFILNVIIANIAKAGYIYRGSLAYGAIIESYLYAPAFVVMLLPFITGYVKKRWQILGMVLTGSLSFILLVLSMRRMAVIIAGAGLILYFAWYRKINYRYVLLFLLAVLMLYPFYKDLLVEQVRARGWVFQKDYSIRNELRYKETVSVWGEALSFKEPLISLFGREIWNSRGNYAGGAFNERTIHCDYNLVLHGAGFIGLILYLGIFADIFMKFAGADLDRKMKAVFISLFVLSFVVSFVGRMNFVTFRFIIFAYLGGILSQGFNK